MSYYNKIDQDMKFLAKSEIRLKILSELQKTPLSIKELVEKTNITYSSVSSNVNKLEKSNYVHKSKNRYILNPLSEVNFNSLMEFKKSIDLIKNLNDFWHKHNIDLLSMESIQNINDLKESELIETTPIDIYKTHNTVKEYMLKTNNMKAIFPYIHPEYPKLIENILKKDGSVELIVPKAIFSKIILSIDEDIRENAARNGKLKVYRVKNDLNIYLAILDETMSLGLFKNDGSFDQNRILISNDEKSKIWACNLFKHVKNEM